MKTLLSLFDYSGRWSLPFAEAGWDVIRWDIKLFDFMNINLLTDCEVVFDLFEHVDGIIAAPPCTDIAVSGAQYWQQKDSDGRTEQSMELCRQVFRLANLFTPTDPDYFKDSENNVWFWAMENPVGRLNKLFPELEAPYYFHPHEFAGYLNLKRKDLKRLDNIRLKDGKGVTNEEMEFVIRCNAYTKKTGIWGCFNRNLNKLPVDNVKTTAQGSFTQKFGGKTDKTKESRSNTPLGFARAFFEANHNYQPHHIFD